MTETRARRSLKAPIIIAVVALLATAAVVATQLSSNSDEPNRAAKVTKTESAPPLPGLERRKENDPLAVGDVDAPVVMVNYSEFQCPYCGKFARDTEPKLIKKYVDKGVLRIEWRDFPYLGKESGTAAMAGRAAADQDKFWEFNKAMFADQQTPNSGKLTTEFFVKIATKIGLDTEEFRADLDSKKNHQAIQKDFDEGQSIGVSGTPAFIINGTPVMGAQPVGVFEDAIEEAAAAAK